MKTLIIAESHRAARLKADELKIPPAERIIVTRLCDVRGFSANEVNYELGYAFYMAEDWPQIKLELEYRNIKRRPG